MTAKNNYIRLLNGVKIPFGLLTCLCYFCVGRKRHQEALMGLNRGSTDSVSLGLLLLRQGKITGVSRQGPSIENCLNHINGLSKNLLPDMSRNYTHGYLNQCIGAIKFLPNGGRGKLALLHLLPAVS